MIFNIFKQEIKSSYKSVLFWSIGLSALVVIGFYEYGAIMRSGQTMDQLFDMMPRIIRVMFGAGQLSLDSPKGFYACMFLFISLICYAHAVLLGAQILAKEERDKTAEFLFTRPVKRSTVITAKILAGLVCLAVIALVAYFGSVFSFLPYTDGVDMKSDLAMTFCGMFVTQILFFFLGLFVSTIFKDAKKATAISAGLLFVSYLGGVFIEMSGNKNLDALSPMRYFNGVSVMEHGFETVFVVLTIALTALLVFFSYRCFEKRNLNV